MGREVGARKIPGWLEGFELKGKRRMKRFLQAVRIISVMGVFRPFFILFFCCVGFIVNRGF